MGKILKHTHTCVCVFVYCSTCAKAQSRVLNRRYNKYLLLDYLGAFQVTKKAFSHLLFHSTSRAYWGLENHFHLWVRSGSLRKTTFTLVLLTQNDKLYHCISGRPRDNSSTPPITFIFSS